jgi:Putative bacterial sensory transduction regulator
MRNIILPIAVAFAAPATAAMQAAPAAQPAPAVPVSTANVVANPTQILAVMRKAGYTVELKGEKDETYLRATKGKDSYNINVSFFGCDEKTVANCKSVQFYAAFSPKTKPTLEAMNDYAARHRWGRIYRDKENDPVIEMDVDLEKGGMSEALFLDNLEYFEAITARFADFAFNGK